MSNELCPVCRGPLKEVTNTGGWMNAEQFDASKAGDFYCEKCPSNGRSNADKFCYWNRSEAIIPSSHFGRAGAGIEAEAARVVIEGLRRELAEARADKLKVARAFKDHAVKICRYKAKFYTGTKRGKKISAVDVANECAEQIESDLEIEFKDAVWKQGDCECQFDDRRHWSHCPVHSGESRPSPEAMKEEGDNA